MQIQEYTFNQAGRELLATYSKGLNWPVVYLISNDKDLYIGETTSAVTRMDQHLQNPQKQRHNLTTIKIVFDDEYNKSVILDYEQRLIKCCKTDAKYNVINRNSGQSSSHEYYQRKEYGNKFGNLWAELVNIGIANKSLAVLENEEIFKYSPYNSLTEEQNAVSVAIINDFCDKLENPDNHEGISIVDGCAGTGKTVLAISIINSLVNAQQLDVSDLTQEEMDTEKVKALLRLKSYLDSSNGHPLKIGFVFPMTGIRDTIRKVFKSCGNGLKANMVVGPSDLAKYEYDILFVDESHRLSRRKNLTSFGNFDVVCEKLGFDKMEASQLDWVIKQGKYNVLFYDEDQSVKSSDITYSQYQNTIESSGKSIQRFKLSTQMRCAGGDAFITYIKSIIDCTQDNFEDVSNYDFRLFDDADNMINEIRNLDGQYGLCRTVAGFSWPWVTHEKGTPKDNMDKYNRIVDSGRYDITIQGKHYIWNLTTEDWISRKDSVYTIGCIHTTQGFDLNYVGVIFGEEIDYNPEDNCITVNLGKFYDKKVKAACDEETVKKYILNTYTTILARGIKGCYVYACNENLRNYLHKYIRSFEYGN